MHSMSKRVTIVLEDSVHKKLRAEQSRLIKDSDYSVSFSSVINNVCKDALG